MKVMLKELRESRGLTQEQLGDMVGVSNKTVSNWELGKSSMPVSMAVDICEILNCSPNQMFGWSDSATTSDESALLNKWRMLDADAKRVVSATITAAQPKKRADYPIPEEGIA